MSSYRLLLFDLDGTLLTEDRRISDENLHALHSLMRAGIRVGLATGRTLRSVQPYVELLRPNGPLILFNGARVWDTEKREFLHQENLGFEEALLALEMGSSLPDTHINLYVGNEILISHRTPRSTQSEIKDGVPHTVVGNLVEWMRTHRQEPVKVMFISEPERMEKLKSNFAARSPRPCSLIRSEAEYLEITRQGVNKGSAMRAIERLYGIAPTEIIAFGDNLNDMEMIQACGIGVAMGNAHADLKAVAKKVIGPHTAPAIGTFLKEVFPSQLC